MDGKNTAEKTALAENIDSRFAREFLEKACYPHPQKDYCAKLLVKASKLRLDTGHGGIRVIGKGWSSIVLLAHSRTVNDYIVLKIRRIDSRRNSLLRDAVYLHIASKYKISPKIYYYDNDVIALEPVLGPSFSKTIMTREYCELVLRRLLWKTFLLDRLGINHSELAIPYGHILLDYDYEPYIIDYESARFKKRPKNTTQVVGALLRIKPPCITINTQEIRPILREYKVKQNIKTLHLLVNKLLR